MSTTNGLIRILDALDASPAATALRSRSYDLLHLAPGETVADVGCGAGRAVAELTEKGARAIGVDLDEEMIATAGRRHPEADFRLAPATALPLADGELTGYRADKLYHVLDDAAQALREARRTLRPGGRLVLLGQDWDTFVIDSDHPGLTRAIVHARADLMPAPRAARRYRNLLLDAGFDQVEVEAHTGLFTDGAMLPFLAGLAHAALDSGAITQEAHDTWTAEQTARAERGRLFLAVPMFVASATRP
ncbi:methyltransferase domain-containing protein [Nonomuraea sp. NBC_01738]|uniref:methyltransferase domain-containing protein n=1 Tax=Nonomuraea sp. NBC_01738 TaxID=2976003 RepID=UPI002E10929A|nr:methyltransferase domain-containing protein [Nonomuraea sp. NBC_01738]